MTRFDPPVRWPRPHTEHSDALHTAPRRGDPWPGNRYLGQPVAAPLYDAGARDGRDRPRRDGHHPSSSSASRAPGGDPGLGCGKGECLDARTAALGAVGGWSAAAERRSRSRTLPSPGECRLLTRRQRSGDGRVSSGGKDRSPQRPTRVTPGSAPGPRRDGSRAAPAGLSLARCPLVGSVLGSYNTPAC